MLHAASRAAVAARAHLSPTPFWQSGRTVRWSLTVLALLALAAVACVPSGAAPAASSGAKRYKVVTTVAPITNIVQNVGGSRIDVTGIVPEGSDSHTFEPAPSDAKLLAEADLILINGLHLEEPTKKLALANRKSGVQIIELGSGTITEKDWIFDFSFPKEQGDPNPHLWMNVVYAKRYAEIARDELSKLDAANKAYYEENTRRYSAALDKLDVAVKLAIQTIPAANRKLITYHDSFAYFAPRYGMTVIGAIQPSDFKEPSPKELADLTDQLKKEKVPAVFGSEVFPSKVLEQLGREAGVKFVDTLRDDDMPGAKDAPEHTYIGMILEDVSTMSKALGGKDDALKGVDPKNTFIK
ncbi:MAG: metal ABC transporter substrate-binding protein [Chloroflexi bacterium]|nr:metal ABC transporter substrate-binding protein [Chloroflexota bacterium]